MRRLLRWIAWIGALPLMVLVASEIVAHTLDPATADERAVLSAFVPTVSPPECIPPWTSGALERSHGGHWVEVDEAERAQLDAAAGRAKPRNVALRIDGGWLLPFLAWMFDQHGCAHPVQIGTPAHSG